MTDMNMTLAWNFLPITPNLFDTLLPTALTERAILITVQLQVPTVESRISIVGQLLQRVRLNTRDLAKRAKFVDRPTQHLSRSLAWIVWDWAVSAILKLLSSR